MANDYQIGYCRPPRHSRFRKGQSGNPKGRPRGTKNLKTDLREELQEHITVREGERERRISKQRALLKSLTAKAIKGDMRAAGTLLNIVLRVLEGGHVEDTEAPLTAEERDVLAVFERRLARQTPSNASRDASVRRKRPHRRDAG